MSPSRAGWSGVAPTSIGWIVPGTFAMPTRPAKAIARTRSGGSVKALPGCASRSMRATTTGE